MATNQNNRNQSSFPGLLEVGNSGQPSLVQQRITGPVGDFFRRSAEQARGPTAGELAVQRLNESKNQPATPATDTKPSGGYMRDAWLKQNNFDFKPNTNSLPGSSIQLTSPSSDLNVSGGPQRSFRRDAFGPSIANQGLTSGDRLANQGYTAQALGGVQGVMKLINSANGRTIYTNDQGNTADWIEGGMRPGVSTVSSGAPAGGGLVARAFAERGGLPGGIDLNAANASMARANAIRAGMGDLSAQVDFNSGAALSRPKTNEELLRDMLTGPSRSGRKVAAGLIRGQQEDALSAVRLGLDRERLGIEQQRALSEAVARGFQNRAAQRLEDLQLQYEQASPADRPAIAEQIRLWSGRAEQKPQNAQVIYNEELINPAQPMAGTRRVPMILNRDGTASVVTPRAELKALPNGVSRDAAIQAARRALQGGYDREAVLARLGEYGLTIEDITR